MYGHPLGPSIYLCNPSLNELQLRKLMVELKGPSLDKGGVWISGGGGGGGVNFV